MLAILHQWTKWKMKACSINLAQSRWRDKPQQVNKTKRLFLSQIVRSTIFTLVKILDNRDCWISNMGIPKMRTLPKFRNSRIWNDQQRKLSINWRQSCGEAIKKFKIIWSYAMENKGNPRRRRVHEKISKQRGKKT